MYSLEQLGWGAFFQSQLDTVELGLVPARVAEEQRGQYVLLSERGATRATVRGRLLNEGLACLPVTGDWVMANHLSREPRSVIEATLERRTVISRKAPGERVAEQVLAANVDTVFVAASLNQELNARRIERYLSVIWQGGAVPVVVLNKTDLCGDVAAVVAELAAAAPGVEVRSTSAITGDGLEALRAHLGEGRTVAFAGSSGVGKSSLVNRLLGRGAQATQEIRSDDKGRHTTTARQMLIAPGGGLIIDTPGLRELGLWDVGAGVSRTFADVEDLARECAFADCSHEREPGCAVKAGIDDGRLDLSRLDSYRKLQREQAFIVGKKDVTFRIEQRKKWKAIQKANRQRTRSRGW